jgi:DNA-binding HxlR family transcriptional regulator
MLWHGKHTFQELQNSEEKLPPNILSQRLKKMMDWGLVDKEAYQDKPVRYLYVLPSEGRALEPTLLQIMAWGHTQLGGGLYDPEERKTVANASS